MRYYVKENELFSEVASRLGFTPEELLDKNPNIPRGQTLAGAPCIAEGAWREGLALEVGRVGTASTLGVAEVAPGSYMQWNLMSGFACQNGPHKCWVYCPTPGETLASWASKKLGVNPQSALAAMHSSANYAYDVAGIAHGNSHPDGKGANIDNPPAFNLQAFNNGAPLAYFWDRCPGGANQANAVVFIPQDLYKLGVSLQNAKVTAPKVVVGPSASATIDTVPTPVFTGAKPAGLSVKPGVQIVANGVLYAANYGLPQQLWQAVQQGSAWLLQASVPMSVSFTNGPTVISVAAGQSILPYVQVLAKKGAGGGMGPTGPSGHGFPGHGSGSDARNLAGPVAKTTPKGHHGGGAGGSGGSVPHTTSKGVSGDGSVGAPVPKPAPKTGAPAYATYALNAIYSPGNEPPTTLPLTYASALPTSALMLPGWVAAASSVWQPGGFVSALDAQVWTAIQVAPGKWDIRAKYDLWLSFFPKFIDEKGATVVVGGQSHGYIVKAGQSLLPFVKPIHNASSAAIPGSAKLSWGKSGLPCIDLHGNKSTTDANGYCIERVANAGVRQALAGDGSVGAFQVPSMPGRHRPSSKSGCGPGQGRGADTNTCIDCGANGLMTDGIHCNYCPPGAFYNKAQNSCDCLKGNHWTNDFTACVPDESGPFATGNACTDKNGQAGRIDANGWCVPNPKPSGRRTTIVHRKQNLAGTGTLGDAPASLLGLWDLNACTLTIDAAAFDAAGVYDALKLAAAYGIPLQGPGGLNQAQVGTNMKPDGADGYFQNGAVLKMPQAACDVAKAQAQPPAATPDPATPDPTHGADPTAPADAKGMSTGAMVGVAAAGAAAIVGGYFLLRRKGKGKRK
jgi:hypothetical protein